MPDLSSVSQYPLKVIFTVHLILISWSTQGHWCPPSALLYNGLFFICILWAIYQTESDEPLQMALTINVLAIIFDITTLSMFFPRYDGREEFSAASMIINLIVRAVTSLYLLRIGQARGGALSTIFSGGPAMGIGRQDYEDISHSVPQNSDFVGI